MDYLTGAYEYFVTHQDSFWTALAEHLLLSLCALGLAVAVCVPLGIWIARRDRFAQPVINAFSAIRVVPSLVILFVALPYLGTGFKPALVALTVLAFPPVLINTYTGMKGVDASVVEAASGMGMSARQQLTRIEVPLALPAILAGVRTSGVEVVASATLASLIGGGGLGDFIVRGYSLLRPEIMLVGAVPVAILALISEGLLGGLQRRLSHTAT